MVDTEIQSLLWRLEKIEAHLGISRGDLDTRRWLVTISWSERTHQHGGYAHKIEEVVEAISSESAMDVSMALGLGAGRGREVSIKETTRPVSSPKKSHRAIGG